MGQEVGAILSRHQANSSHDLFQGSGQTLRMANSSVVSVLYEKFFKLISGAVDVAEKPQVML
jgi:hypothetical protein